MTLSREATQVEEVQRPEPPFLGGFEHAIKPVPLELCPRDRLVGKLEVVGNVVAVTFRPFTARPLLITDALCVLLIATETRVGRGYVWAEDVGIGLPISPSSAARWRRQYPNQGSRTFRIRRQWKNGAGNDAKDRQTTTKGQKQSGTALRANDSRRQCEILSASRETPPLIPSLSAGSLCSLSVSFALVRSTSA